MQQTVKNATKGAAPIAVTEGAKALDEQATRDRIVHFMDSAEMQTAIRNAAKATVEGAAQGLGDSRRFEELASGIAAMATHSAIDAALTEADSPAGQRQMQQIATIVADSAVRSATHALAEEIPATLAPAVAAAIQRDLAPSMRSVLESPEFRAAMAQNAYQMAHGAVLGSNAALAELEKKKEKSGMLARVGGWLANSGWLLFAGGLLLFLLVATNVAFLSKRVLNRHRSKARGPIGTPIAARP